MITLAIPCVRRYDLLQGLLDSAERGTRKPDSYVVIDNGNAIRTSGVRLPPNTDLIEPGTNLGVSATWNLVMSRYEDHVIFSNDDVILDANTVEVLAGAAETTDAVFIFPRMDPPTTFCVFLIKHECHRVVGPFDENFWPAYYEDCDYHRRIKFAGVKELIVEGTGYMHILNGYLKTMTPEEHMRFAGYVEKNHNYYLEKWGGPPGGETFSTPWGK